jgi:lipoate-protein ligase A
LRVWDDGRKKLQGESPAIDEPVSVDAREEASKVLIVYTWCRKIVEIGVFEELDEIKDISFCQVEGKLVVVGGRSSWQCNSTWVEKVL